MAGGAWDPTTSEVRPGLYINFQNAASAQIKGGSRGIVAMPVTAYAVTTTPKTFYTVDNVLRATELLGAANATSVVNALTGGAKEVLIYTMPPYDAASSVQDFVNMRSAFETQKFNVFCHDGEVTTAERLNSFNWMKTNKADGKHFMAVFGGSTADDADPAVGNTRSAALKDDYAVNVIVGFDGKNSSQVASYVAGMIAGTPINKSITYAQISGVTDVNKRLTNSQIKTALLAGSLVIVHDGEKVKVERGVTTAIGKVRTTVTRIAISTDVTKTAADNYIGKVDNNVDGQKALISAIKAYLERLAASNVLTSDITVALDAARPSTGDSVYITIKVVEVDSMEEIYLTINV